MAEVENTRGIIDAPKLWKVEIWRYFGFYEVDGKVDRSYAICRKCCAKIKHVGNTSNFTRHLARWHPDLANGDSKPTAKPDTSQPTINQSILSQLPQTSERARKITRAVAGFIAKDLRPYSVVENAGFRNMLRTLDPRYKLPVRATLACTKKSNRR